MTAATARTRRYVVATLGSAGDLHPFLAVARALVEAGHDTLMLAAEPHGDEVRAQGVPFAPIAAAHDHLRTLNHPGLWHPLRGFGVLWRHLVVPSIDPTVAQLEAVLARTAPQDLTVFASPLVVGARLLREVQPFRLWTGHTAPSGLRSCADPMHLAGWRVPAWWPRPARRALWNLLDRSRLEPMARPRIEAWLTARGAPPPDGPVFDRWIHGPDGVLGLFPPDFGPMPQDWPVPVTPVGFPLYQPATLPQPLEPPFTEFLATPPERPRVLMYLGSASATRPADFARLARTLLAQGATCLAITPSRIDVPEQPGWWQTDRHAPLPQLLPGVDAFIHHGGIGACAQGLAAGAPQFVLPSAYDQHDNAWRVMGGLSLETHRGLPKALLRKRRESARISPAWVPKHSEPKHPNACVQTVLSCLQGHASSR